MANYYSSNAVEKLGRRLNWGPKGLNPVGFNETAIAVADNGLWRIASDDLHDLHRSYSSGMFLTFDVFAVPKDKLSECADQGREQSTVRERRKAAMRKPASESPENG